MSRNEISSSTERLHRGHNDLRQRYYTLREQGRNVEAAALKPLIPPTRGPGFNTRYVDNPGEDTVTPLHNTAARQDHAEKWSQFIQKHGHWVIKDQPPKRKK